MDAPTPPSASIAQDMATLCAVQHRFAGTEGERAMLHAVRARLPDPDAARIEGFVAHVSVALVYGLHAGLLLLAGVLGFFAPALGAVGCALLTLSLIGEGTGRFHLLRWLLWKSASYNLVVRLPAAQPGALGAVVLAAPLDVPAWRPLKRSFSKWRPLKLVLAAAFVVTTLGILRTLAEPWGPRTLELYVAALVVLFGAMIVGVMGHRVGEGQDDSGAPAALIELVRRFSADPVPQLDVWVAFTGCGRAFQGGMDAFLALHQRSLAEPCLVVALDDVGHPPLRAAASEGSMIAQGHRPTGPALVERLRWAGIVVPSEDRGGATDARLALVRGYRALAFAGGDEPATPEAATRAADVVETLVRWLAEDLSRVAERRPHLQRLAAPAQPPPAEPERDAS